MYPWRLFHVASCLGYTLLCLIWRAHSGLVRTWDQVHYHLYVAHAWWQNRLPDELFAAGAQSYLNPLPHLPFYAAYQTGAHSLIIVLCMAALHSINLWLLHFISCQLITPEDRMRRLLVICSVIIGASSPGFLYETGTSYADVIVSIPALGSFLLLLIWLDRTREEPNSHWRAIYATGLLAGIAIGFKPTSLVFCASLFAAAALATGRSAWGVVWRASLAGSAGLAISGGPHAWLLWKSFGNPVFPLFNATFRSPWFPPVSIVSDRFRPTSLEMALRFPLDMANSLKRVSFEEQIVDIRLLWLLSLAAITVVMFFLRRIHSARRSLPPNTSGKRLFWFCLALFFPAWVCSSANIRYAVEFLLLLGPAIGLLALGLVGKQRILALLAILLPLSGQAVLNTTLNAVAPSESRWDRWPPDWFEVSLPPTLNQKPALYISLQSISFASLAPKFPEESRFFNLIGSTPQSPSSRFVQEAKRYYRTKALPLRTLYQEMINAQPLEVSKEQIATQNALLSEYGYRIDERDCALIGTEDRLPTTTPPLFGKLTTNSFRILISCAVTEAAPLPPEERQRRKVVDARINRWIEKCPKSFAPDGFWSLQFPAVRKRHFPSSDVQIVELSTGELKAIYWNTDIPIVTLEDKNGVALISECPRKERQ